jgi:thiaminase (transcriptional activator TenA)
MTRFTDELRAAADEIWEAQLAHPFVRGVADGTLPTEPFRHYVRQDYLFLIEYARLLALGCARAPRVAEMERLAALARAVLETEMELHRGYAEEWGISREELETERPTATTRAYSDFLLRTAALGDFAELVSALLPCMWGYSWLGKRLADGERPADERLARWIEMYASDEFAQLADWCREVTDAAAEGAGAEGRARMCEAFLTSSRYELAFWEMAWREEPPL